MNVGPFHFTAPSAISIMAPSEYQRDLDAGIRPTMRRESGRPRLHIVQGIPRRSKDRWEWRMFSSHCLLFKDEDTNHGDDDDRRNLSPSGSHYVSNLQATTAGDGGRLRRRTSRFLSSFPVLQSSNQFGEDRGARAEGMSFVCIFSTLCRVEAYISFLIFKSTPPLLPYCGRMVDGGGRLGVGFAS